MRLFLVLTLLFVLVACLPAQADFRLVGKIPAPEADSGCTRVTGLDVADGNLFATVRCDTSSFLFLISPYTGAVVEEKEMDGSPPDCPGDSVELLSGTYEGFGHYWLGDACGDFINVVWVYDSLAVYGSFTSDSVETPSGLCYQGDTLFTVDYDTGMLAGISRFGQVLTSYYLPPIDSPTGLTLYRNHFFLASATNDSLIFEVSKEAAMIDTHFVAGLSGTYPLSATFFDGYLYVGSESDSILIFEPVTFNTYVPCGDDVTVEVVPEKVSITFDHVPICCWIYADVTDAQACPAPDSVQLFSDVYEITTCAAFEYESHISIQDTAGIPGEANKVRVFSRSSGSCTAFRDISVDTLAALPVLRHLSRIKSEDDEFSVFALGVDERDPEGIIERKFVYTDAAITANEDSMPGAVYLEITALLAEAEIEFRGGDCLMAAALVDSLAEIVRDSTAIPHTYYPGEEGHNIAGLIISQAHTLSFSLGGCDDLSGVPVKEQTAGSGLVLRPNPSSTSFAIEFESVSRQPVNVSIYSVRGRLVRMLLKNEVRLGRIGVVWEGDNEQGHRVASGAYFAVVRQGERTEARKVILQR